MNDIIQPSMPEGALQVIPASEVTTMAKQFESSVRAHPIPLVVTAAAAGLLMGAVARLLLFSPNPSAVKVASSGKVSDQLLGSLHNLHEFVAPLVTTAGKAMASGVSKSSSSVQEAAVCLPNAGSLWTHLRAWWTAR